MDLSRSSFDSSMAFLAVMALLAALLAVRAVPAPHKMARPQSEEMLEIFGASGAALLLTALLTGHVVDQLPIFVLFLNVAAILRYYVNRLSMPGVLWMTVQPLAMLVSGVWVSLGIVEAQLPFWVEGLAFAGLGSALLFFALDFAERFAREAVLTHEQWRRPIAPPLIASSRPAAEAMADRHEYKVSLHLPCYAEPPEVVKATMDSLAAQDYQAFEVLVCDNNTKDEALWRPLEAHCAVLNRRLGREVFRFFHKSPLPGAKAGALNFCLTVMAPDTEIVAVVDADYQARPDFLSRLTPFFDDPGIAYVQTPHDYRAYEGSDYLTACYWEYMPNNKVDMPGVSEYGGAFTIGTMCLLRAGPLQQVGGWAEWCLTEDSEVSVRLRAAGYHGLYLGETFGRGLIPETFDDYKKQRFRWTAGPVQQLRRYWHLFLPAPFAPPMPGWTKLLEILRCVAPLRMLFGLVCAIFGLAATSAALATATMAPIDIPDIGWLVLILGMMTGLVRTWHRYRLAGCSDVGAMIHGEIARMSLSYVILVAGIGGLSSKPLAWRRTPKFAVEATKETPFTSTLIETGIGGISLFIGLLALMSRDVLGVEFATLAFLGAAGFALRFLSAPYMAALAIRHVNREAASGGTGDVDDGRSPSPAL
ncbi:MAG: glycosyltransferase [Sphingomonadales bacterium]|nr:MAG: glycosyltransferase [Sphingomonadales bacterium]TNF03208.1 MAG: glycosyltransferase [Sphingomonadales bacterium]